MKRIVEMQELDQNLWDGDTLRPEVRSALAKVGMSYYETLELQEPMPEDILFVGSAAGYTYTDRSDIDVHILLDSDKQPKWGNEPLMAYALAKAALWNRQHEVSVRGRRVEVFAHDVRGDGKDLKSAAVYSLFRNTWVRKQPDSLKDVPPDAMAKMEAALTAWSSESSSRIAADRESGITFALESIYAMRHQGLERGGENDPFNLAFKRVRAAGVLDSLKDAKRGDEDADLTLECQVR